MSGSDAFSHEMAGFPLPSWLSHEPDELLLDKMLAGQPLPPDAPQGMLVLAQKLADLSGPAKPGELTGEAAALLAFNRVVPPASVSPVSHKRSTHRRSRLASGRLRLASALTAAGLVLGGTAAAYAGALPASVQDFAHKMIGAPAAQDADHQQDQSHGRRAHGSPSDSAPGHTQHADKNGKNGLAKGRVRRGLPAHPAVPAPSHVRPTHPAHGSARQN